MAQWKKGRWSHKQFLYISEAPNANKKELTENMRFFHLKAEVVGKLSAYIRYTSSVARQAVRFSSEDKYMIHCRQGNSLRLQKKGDLDT